jgi:hypothetical protein
MPFAVMFKINDYIYGIQLDGRVFRIHIMDIHGSGKWRWNEVKSL